MARGVRHAETGQVRDTGMIHNTYGEAGDALFPYPACQIGIYFVSLT